MTRRPGLATTFLALVLSGCFGPQRLAPLEDLNATAPESYEVKSGDTLFAIAWRYGLDYREIAAWNRLDSPDRIYAGQTLRLRPAAGTAAPSIDLVGRSLARTSPPPASPPTPAPRVPPAASTSRNPSASRPARTVEALSWQWPAEGEVARDFRPEVPGRKGIQISGRAGEVVRAASPGLVVYSGSGLPGYGRLIIVKHSDTLLSAYGYLGRITTKEGERVAAGQKIAEMSGGNRPLLHFEIRRNGKPVNPLKYLPG